jgi:hypothetical protein
MEQFVSDGEQDWPDYFLPLPLPVVNGMLVEFFVITGANANFPNSLCMDKLANRTQTRRKPQPGWTLREDLQDSMRSILASFCGGNYDALRSVP